MGGSTSREKGAEITSQNQIDTAMLAVIAAFDPIPEAEKALVAMADVPDEDPKKLYVASQIVQHEVKV